MGHYWQEISALTMRWVLRLSREKFSMLFTLVQPMLFWLIFFGNLFQRAADTQITQAPELHQFSRRRRGRDDRVEQRLGWGVSIFSSIKKTGFSNGSCPRPFIGAPSSSAALSS